MISVWQVGLMDTGILRVIQKTTEAMEVLMWVLLCSVHAQRICTT